MHANEEHLLLLFAHANAGFGVSDLPRVVLEGSLKHSHNPTGGTSLQPVQDLAVKLLHIAVQPRAPWHEVHDLPTRRSNQAKQATNRAMHLSHFEDKPVMSTTSDSGCHVACVLRKSSKSTKTSQSETFPSLGRS